jgi:hypothetical protein
MTPRKATRVAAETSSARDPDEIASFPTSNFVISKPQGKFQTAQIGEPAAHRIDILSARRMSGSKWIAQGRYFASYLGARIGEFRVPESDFARWLLGHGHAAPDDKLVMCWNGRPALTGSVGWLADHTVEENVKVGARWAKFQPFDLKPSDALSPVCGDAQDGRDAILGYPPTGATP